MALPVEQSISVLRGTDNLVTFTLVDALGVAVDITLDTVKFSVREGITGPIRIAKKTNGPGQHVTPAAGVTAFKILKTEIDNEVAPVAVTTWKYEVRRVTATTLDEFVYFQGDLIINPAVTEG